MAKQRIPFGEYFIRPYRVATMTVVTDPEVSRIDKALRVFVDCVVDATDERVFAYEKTVADLIDNEEMTFATLFEAMKIASDLSSPKSAEDEG